MLHLQGVFTYLIESLGTKNVQFEELISLDSESLQQLNPIGVIFLFKYPTGEKQQKDKPQDGEFDFAAVEAQGEENVWFAAQTIQNACGTQALLSVLLNKDGSSEDGHVDIGPNLREFKEFTSGFPADVCWKSTALLLPIDMLTCYIQLRGEALSNSDLIRDTHNSFARSSPFVSDETRTATGDDDVYHFIAYTSINDTTSTHSPWRCWRMPSRDLRRCGRACTSDQNRKIPTDRDPVQPAGHVRRLENTSEGYWRSRDAGARGEEETRVEVGECSAKT
jgi:hypothetical protein